MQRRDFLDAGARLALAGAFSPQFFGAAREPLAPPFLDAHVHSRSPALIAYHGRNGGLAVGGAELVRRLDADGARRAVVLSTAYRWRPT